MTFHRRIALVSAGLLSTAGLTAGLAAPSSAAPKPPTSEPTAATAERGDAALDAIKRDGAQAIAVRQAQLTKLAGRLAAAPTCDADGTIAGVIAADGPALTALGTKLASDTTVAEARADRASIFEDFRVFAVVTPQASVTSACGHIETAAASLAENQTKLAARVDEAAAGGADMTAARTALADMTAQLAEATAQANDANASLAAIGPDHGDAAVAATNRAAVDHARAELQDAHGDLEAALADARAVVAELKAAAAG